MMLVAIIAVSVCGSCARKRPSIDSGRAPIIGFSLDSLVVERWKRDLDVFSRSARELGAEVVMRVADQDPVLQEAQVRELVNIGIDVLVIVPNDADRLSEVVRYARRRGVKVLSYDRLVRNAGVDLYISFDNEKVGSLMADALLKEKPEGSFIIINGARSDNNAIMLNHGIHAVLDPSVTAGRARIFAEIWPAEWDSDEIRHDLEDILKSTRSEGNGGIDAVVAGNDMLAEAAIATLSESRMMTGVLVAGQDADLSACQRIAEGTQYATIYKPIERLALKAAGFAVMMAHNEPIPTDVMIDDGTGKVPFVRLEPILVTRELLDATVIKDGFHTAESVYRNIRR
jgi:D-xylose transport system substrate-binding protein